VGTRVRICFSLSIIENMKEPRTVRVNEYDKMENTIRGMVIVTNAMSDLAQRRSQTIW
jgi:hypothetical protein